MFGLYYRGDFFEGLFSLDRQNTMAKKAATTASTKKATTKKAPATKKAAKKATKKGAEADGDEEVPVKKKKAKRKSKKKVVEELRLRVFWGVFNHAMKRVALYEFNQRKAAEKRAAELSPEGKPPHFVQKVKEVITVEEIADPDAPAEETPVKKKKKA